MDSVKTSIIQAFEESPTRKIVRKEGKLYYMLEDEDGIPDLEEQRRYRAIIKEELGELRAEKYRNKDSEEMRMLFEEVEYFEDED